MQVLSHLFRRLLQAALLVRPDDFVGDGVHTRRYGQPERLCGPEVDDKLEFGRQFDRQVTAFTRPQ